MSIREFLDALRSTQGQHTLASVLEGPESGERLLLCEGVPVWPARPEGLLARNLPALAGCGASGILTLENKRIFVEKFGGAPRLVICGGGHVAESVVRLAVMLGLPVTGLEERPEYADALRRAGAEKVLCGPYAENLTQVEGSAETYFVVATRAHSFDVECLTEIYKKRFAYVGMLGSRSRSALVRRQLIEAGTAPEKAEELHAPIGLAIKAQTAQEIALSILAEIVEVKNGRQQTEGFLPELLNALDACTGQGKAPVLMTIVSRHGSTPREVGAKMLVLPDGRSVGSVGGGIMEYRVQQLASKMQAGEAAPCQLAEYSASAKEDDAALDACTGQGKAPVLVTIVSRHGSTPREVGAKMLVLPDGRSVGSVGGGIMEYRVQQLASKMQAGEAAPCQLAEYSASAKEDDAALAACGGSMNVFLQLLKEEENNEA